MGYNMPANNDPASLGGSNLLPDPTQSPPAVSARATHPCDPQQSRLAAVIATAGPGVEHYVRALFGDAELAKAAGEAASAAAVALFALSCRVAWEYRIGVGVAMARAGVVLGSLLRSSLRTALHVYSGDGTEAERGLLAGDAIWKLGEQGSLPPEREAIGAAACAAARLVVERVGAQRVREALGKAVQS
jgi:hypothetical protein